VDLTLYFGVIRRFRALIGVGAVVAVVLAVLSMVRIDLTNGKPAVRYRETQTWASRSQLLITQTGFPWGRTVLPGSVPGSSIPPGTPSFADPGRFYQLASFYSRLANSDAVQEVIKRRSNRVGTVEAVPETDPTSSSGAAFPFVDIIGSGPTPTIAKRLATIGTTAFREYIEGQQDDAGIPDSQRVDVQIVNTALPPILVQGRKKTLPIAIFLGVMIMTVGAAFILENLRPRIQVSSGSRVADDLDKPRRAAA
jgi:hypothetical protein